MLIREPYSYSQFFFGDEIYDKSKKDKSKKRKNNTFSDKDLIRIYLKNLTHTERIAVREFFSQELFHLKAFINLPQSVEVTLWDLVRETHLLIFDSYDFLTDIFALDFLMNFSIFNRFQDLYERWDKVVYNWWQYFMSIADTRQARLSESYGEIPWWGFGTADEFYNQSTKWEILS